MQSPLQLDAYLIDELNVAVNVEFDADSDMEADVQLIPKHLVSSEHPGLHQLVLDVRFAGPDGNANAYPYRGRIVGRGMFHIDDEQMPEDEASKLILVNGSAILLGLLRGHVSQVTALGLHGPLLLPAMNIVQAWEDAASADHDDANK